MAAALTLMPSAASAEFRYVAPTAARAGLVVLDDAAEGGKGVWRVEAGDTLRTVLERWGGRAGIETLFLTDRRYRLHRGQEFHGAFIDAVRALFFALSHLPHPPTGELAPGGRSLAVTHRAPQVPPTGD